MTDRASLPKMTFGLLLISHFFSNLYSKKEVFSQSTKAQNLQKATFSSSFLTCISLPVGFCCVPSPDVSCLLSCKCEVVKNSFENFCICLHALERRKKDLGDDETETMTICFDIIFGIRRI